MLKPSGFELIIIDWQRGSQTTNQESLCEKNALCERHETLYPRLLLCAALSFYPLDHPRTRISQNILKPEPTSS